MSSTKNSQETQTKPGPSMPRSSIPPTSGGTITTRPELDKAIEYLRAVEDLKHYFKAADDDNRIISYLNMARVTVYVVVKKAGVPQLQKRLRNESEFNSLVTHGSDEERKLVNLLKSMAGGEVDWKELFVNEVFFKPEKNQEGDTALELGTTRAWDSEYKGDLALVLFDTISDYLSRDRDPFTRLTTVINSSGTGKSRMVDQLGTEIITVPMCLRRTGNGFPPPDEGLRDWLVSGAQDKATVQIKLHGFTYSLLMATHKRLETIAIRKMEE